MLISVVIGFIIIDVYCFLYDQSKRRALGSSLNVVEGEEDKEDVGLMVDTYGSFMCEVMLAEKIRGQRSRGKPSIPLFNAAK